MEERSLVRPITDGPRDYQVQVARSWTIMAELGSGCGPSSDPATLLKGEKSCKSLRNP